MAGDAGDVVRRRADFYHLTRWPLETALPKLAEKALAAGLRVGICAENPDRVRSLSDLLWTHEAGSFLPHGDDRDGDPAPHPVFVTAAPASAIDRDVLILTGGVWPETLPGVHRRLLTLFDGADPDSLAAARRHWAAARDLGFEMHYWQQTEAGGFAERPLSS